MSDVGLELVDPVYYARHVAKTAAERRANPQEDLCASANRDVELVPRLESIELAGRPERLASSFVGGVKHLPIRYEVGR